MENKSLNLEKIVFVIIIRVNKKIMVRCYARIIGYKNLIINACIIKLQLNTHLYSLSWWRLWWFLENLFSIFVLFIVFPTTSFSHPKPSQTSKKSFAPKYDAPKSKVRHKLFQSDKNGKCTSSVYLLRDWIYDIRRFFFIIRLT